MVNNLLVLTVEDELVAHEGMGLAMGWCLGLFYDNKGMVGLRDTKWIQDAPNVLIGLFQRYGMVEKVAKSKAMMCQLGSIRSGMSEEAVS